MSRSLYARLHRRFGPRKSGLTRREFLARAASLAVALPLAGCASLSGRGRSGKGGRRVVVVGAGFAGLACARELRRAALDVTVIEARQRLGGRVVSVGDRLSGKVVEGGGEFIGENHPTWLAYANEFRLDLVRSSENDDLTSPILLEGERLDDDDAKALYDEMSDAYGRMTKDAGPIDADKPWTSDGAALLDTRSTADWLASVPVSRRCRLAIGIEMTSNNGVALDRQSYLANLAQVKGGGLEDYWTQSEIFRCRGGNATLASRLAREVGDDRIHMGTSVARIAVESSRVVVESPTKTFEADDVVVAVPPSTWGRIEFQPALPALLRPQMGVNVKWLAVVKSPFWRERGLAPDSLSDGDVSVTWEATDGQAGDASAVLTAFSGGPHAEACRSRDASARDAAYRDEVEKILPGFASAFVSSRFMDWPADEWTRASYSFPAPGQVTTIAPLLRRALGRLHFAGEHTSSAFVGYMEGALQSGVRIATLLTN